MGRTSQERQDHPGFYKDSLSHPECRFSTKSEFKGGRTECVKSLCKCIERENTTLRYVLALTLSNGTKVVASENVYDVQGQFPRYYKSSWPGRLCDLTSNVTENSTFSHTRLIIGLCHTWMEEQNIRDYLHYREQRKLTSIFCSHELQEAVKCAYKIDNTHKVWEFEMR